jgi:hypothetical protein
VPSTFPEVCVAVHQRVRALVGHPGHRPSVAESRHQPADLRLDVGRPLGGEHGGPRPLVEHVQVEVALSAREGRHPRQVARQARGLPEGAVQDGERVDDSCGVLRGAPVLHREGPRSACGDVFERQHEAAADALDRGVAVGCECGRQSAADAAEEVDLCAGHTQSSDHRPVARPRRRALDEHGLGQVLRLARGVPLQAEPLPARGPRVTVHRRAGQQSGGRCGSTRRPLEPEPVHGCDVERPSAGHPRDGSEGRLRDGDSVIERTPEQGAGGTQLVHDGQEDLRGYGPRALCGGDGARAGEGDDVS